ncbi:MAG TPA: hypothetical protein VIH18_36105 [Candidatus Binatia bacterium]|jgi:hypothetical protein
MSKHIGLVLAAVLLVVTANSDAAVPRRSLSDEQIVAQGKLVASGAYVEIYQHRVAIDPSFLKVMETAYEEVQRITGLKLDTTTYGSKVRVYVSDSIAVSHVWRGYQHPTDPKAIIFLNLRVYHGAMGGKNATHVHELTHLFTWRYNSHTLREGIADYVALKIFPGAAVGPNPGGDSARLEVPPEVLDLLGTAKPPPDWVSTDPLRRAAYYFASYRLVKYLIEAKDLETFWKLYLSENPEMDIKSLYGLERSDAVKAALGASIVNP